MKTTAEKIAVMQAFADGKKVESFYLGKWHAPTGLKLDLVPTWDWANYDYRIAQEPRRIWLNEYTHYTCVYDSKELAEKIASSDFTHGSKPIRTAVEYVEVIKP